MRAGRVRGERTVPLHLKRRSGFMGRTRARAMGHPLRVEVGASRGAVGSRCQSLLCSSLSPEKVVSCCTGCFAGLAILAGSRECQAASVIPIAELTPAAHTVGRQNESTIPSPLPANNGPKRRGPRGRPFAEYAQPANWKANTAVMAGVIIGITAIAWSISADREVRYKMPAPDRFFPSR